MDYFNAFWTGGLICALVQILLDRTKLMPGRIMVLLVCTGSVLSAVGNLISHLQNLPEQALLFPCLVLAISCGKE